MSHAIEIKLMHASKWHNLEKKNGGSVSLELFAENIDKEQSQIIPLSQVQAIEKQFIGKAEVSKITLKTSNYSEVYLTDVPYSNFVDSLCIKIVLKSKRCRN